MRVTLKNVILSYPVLFKPKPIGDSEPKYSATFIFPKGSSIETLKKALTAAKEDKFGKDYKKKLRSQ